MEKTNLFRESGPDDSKRMVGATYARKRPEIEMCAELADPAAMRAYIQVG